MSYSESGSRKIYKIELLSGERNKKNKQNYYIREKLRYSFLKTDNLLFQDKGLNSPPLAEELLTTFRLYDVLRFGFSRLAKLLPPPILAIPYYIISQKLCQSKNVQPKPPEKKNT